MGGPRNKKKDGTIEKYKEYKEACPPHKWKDLDALVKLHKGNEEEIREKIQAWWDEPQAVEPEWEDVNTKSAKKKAPPPNPREGRGPGRGRGRARDAAGGGGRGAGPERRGLRSTRPSPPEPKSPQRQDEPKEEPRLDGPTPVTSAPAPKGAWGQRGVTHTPTTTEPVPSPAKPVTPVKPESREKHVDLVAPDGPTPSGMPASVEKQVRAPSTPSGNVWATKGSAHLIRAEKPRPPPPLQMRMPQRVEPPHSPVKHSLAPPPEPLAATALETGLSPSLSNTETWTASPSLEIQSASSVADTALASLPEVSAPPAPPAISPRLPPAPPPTNVLNMGHWESGEGDDAQNLDFGFGSFGRESDIVEEPANNTSMSAKEAMSPARPPPGLSIGGMPPMPANAVLVHELENKLEGTTLGKEEVSEGPKPMTSNIPSQPPLPGHPGVTPNVPPSYNAAYGMGMYNYNTAGSGFMGVPPAGLGVPPHQKSQTGHHTPPVSGGVPQHIPPGGLYGSAAPSAGITGDSTTSSSNDTSVSGIPPGMPNAMPYNPAIFYGQQPYQMGQPGVGYGYGYGAQFGGAGFYQQQVMGQSGGYASYDDQPPQVGRGDYSSKSSNRYRNSNQYQNQFNPQQHGGYGGQPYSMGYNVDHFNQRGGYGPPDPYGMQPQQQQGSSNYSGGMSSFQDDDHHKGKKGGRGFQQHHQQLGAQQQQQPFLGGGETASSTSQGWSNSNNSNQGGGWGGPSWQGGN